MAPNDNENKEYLKEENYQILIHEEVRWLVDISSSTALTNSIFADILWMK